MSHQKDSFDQNDSGWKLVVEAVRGNGSLLPDTNKKLNQEQNISPMAKLLAGYTRGDAGLRWLVPGDGKQGINDGLIQEFVKNFDKGIEEFQNDSKWFELVELAERGKLGMKGKGGDGLPDIQDDPTNPPIETEPYEPIQFSLSSDPYLSREYKFDSISTGTSLIVTAEKIDDGMLPENKPYTIEFPTAKKVLFKYNPQHEFFTESLLYPKDILIADLAKRVHDVTSTSLMTNPISSIIHKINEDFSKNTLQIATI